MHGTHNPGERSIRMYVDLFTTFLYAAAIHIVIGEFVSCSFEPSLANSLPLVFVIIYFLSDWLSRVRLPNLIHDSLKPWQQLAKAFLEAVGLLFLIMATVLIVTGKTENREAFFAAFLIVSFLWNSVLFSVMTGLDWVPLLDAIWRGAVLDIKAIEEYASTFYSTYQKLIEVENVARKPTTGSNPSQTWRVSLTTIYCTSALIVWIRFVRTFAQYVGIHLGVANLVVGTLLFENAYRERCLAKNKGVPFVNSAGFAMRAWAMMMIVVCRSKSGQQLSRSSQPFSNRNKNFRKQFHF